MGTTGLVLKSLFSKFANYPIKTVTSNKNFSSKIIPGIAIGIFTMFSMGYYAYYCSKYVANKKAVNLQNELGNAINSSDLTLVKNLFQKYPLLKLQKDLATGIKTESFISSMIPAAAENGDLEMVKFLHENGAGLDSSSRAGKTALERALIQNHQDVVVYLIDNKASLTQDMLMNYFMQNDSNLDTMIYLVENMQEIDSSSYQHSLLGIASLLHDEDPGKCEELMSLLLDKGDTLTQGDSKLQIPKQALEFITNRG